MVWAERRLAHLDRLEPTLQRGVLLQVLAVLVEGGGADGLQLATGQHRLEDRRRVDRALGRARTHQRVDLVDEQNDVAAGADLLEDLLQPLLEVTAVTRPGHQGAQVQRVEVLVLQRLGHLALDDPLGEPLHHGGLPDAGLADQDGVVLGPAGEHLHHPLDLLLTPDHRVELALPGGLGQVAPELVQHQRGRGSGLGAGAGAGGGRFLALVVTGEQLDHLLPHAVQVSAQLDQDLCGHTLTLTDQPEQNVLGADVVVPQLQRLPQRELQHLLGPGGERDVPAGGLLSLADDLLDLLPHTLQGDARGSPGPWRRHPHPRG